MEYVNGFDLSEIVRSRGPLPVEHAAYFAYQATCGLQYLHEMGMIHRDIKPTNLMVTRTGNHALIKLIDFSFAKQAGSEEVDAQPTGLNRFCGTPGFTSPEQAVNFAAPDIRGDIYSLGCSLYYLLSGRPPFRGPSLPAILDAHIHREPEPLGDSRPDIPPDFAAVISKMMAKRPNDRFPTPADVGDALNSFFHAQHVTAEILLPNWPSPEKAKSIPIKSIDSVSGSDMIWHSIGWSDSQPRLKNKPQPPPPESDKTPKPIDALRKAVPTEAPYEETVRLLEGEKRDFNERFAARYGEALKAEMLRRGEQSTVYDDKLSLARWVNGELRRFGVSLSSAKTGVGIFSASNAVVEGRFVLKGKAKDEDDKTPYYYNKDIAEFLNQIEIVMTPARRESLAERIAREAENRPKNRRG